MTIHADWAKVFKQRFPHSFTDYVPTNNDKPSCGIIDGHIQLMGAYNVSTWEQFLHNQFVRPITQLFSQGLPLVVLLFDNRMAVSPYKGMTQYKRCKRYQDVQFTQSDPLPVNIPTPWIDHMMNRHFKDKVISMVCEQIQSLVKPTREHALIVDFKGPPKMYTTPTGCPTDIHGVTELGESDVKFARYVHMLGSSVVYATDGDYIPISLLYYSVYGVHPNNNIVIYRQQANIDPPKKKVTAANKTASSSAAKPRKKVMEYINMQPVFHGILQILQCGDTASPHVAMTAFVSMMLLAGTDYSRAIPLIGPKRVIEMFPSITPHVLNSVNTEQTGQGLHVAASPRRLAQDLVMTMYNAAFQKHVHVSMTPTTTLEHLLHALQTSKLSERTKALLPLPQQVEATCRNVTWVVHYWKDCLNAQPDLTQPNQFGFVYDTSNRQYTWSDLVSDADGGAPKNVSPHQQLKQPAHSNYSTPQEFDEDQLSMLIPIDPVINIKMSPRDQSIQLVKAANDIKNTIDNTPF